jgi:hypothetical protein
VLGEPQERALCLAYQHLAFGDQVIAETEKPNPFVAASYIAQQSRRVETVLQAQQGRAIRALGREHAIEEEVPQSGEDLSDQPADTNAYGLLANHQCIESRAQMFCMRGDRAELLGGRTRT